MAKPLSSRRGRKGTAEWSDGGDEERQALANSKARQDTIRMAVRELARMRAEVKALNAEINEFMATHIKGDLGFKIADWNAIYRVSQLETEDRDILLDTLREGFNALGIGGSVDWVAAAEKRPNGAGGPVQSPREAEPDAFELGKADGVAGHRDHGARYPNGEIGAAAYELGHAEGEKERHGEDGGDIGGGEPAAEATAAPRRRGRPRKAAQQELSEADGATHH